MLDLLFRGVFDSSLVTIVSVTDFLLCVGASLFIGLIITLSYMYKTRYTKSFVITLATLPAVVCVVIMMVNGNIGTGVAVAGAFSLVRFRSVPGTAKEISMLFLAMGSGLITGMGYIGYSILFSLILSFTHLVYQSLDLGITKKIARYKTIRITIPEDLDYTGIFDPVFSEYMESHELIAVKTTNMGSMFRLTYDVVLKDATLEKALIDKIRERNGNLEITVSAQQMQTEKL